MDAQSKNQIRITGASGLLGSAITSVLPGTWRALKREQGSWDPENGVCAAENLRNCAAVIHLAGEPIAARRWNEKQKEKIYASRVNGTRALAEALAGLEKKPECLICASATGFYGDRGEELLTDRASPGEAFLSRVVLDWEKAAEPAREAGIRVVHLRLGIVLSAQGGALGKMLPLFKWGLGGKLGNGRMWMSWVHIEDAASAFIYALQHPEITGAYNLTSPNPVRNLRFTKTLGDVLKKATVLPAPAGMLKLLLGEMGEALLLSSTRTTPAALQKTGFEFRHPDLEPALKDLLIRE